jgi:hypothetical protein
MPVNLPCRAVLFMLSTSCNSFSISDATVGFALKFIKLLWYLLLLTYIYYVFTGETPTVSPSLAASSLPTSISPTSSLPAPLPSSTPVTTDPAAEVSPSNGPSSTPSGGAGPCYFKFYRISSLFNTRQYFDCMDKCSLRCNPPCSSRKRSIGINHR